MKSDTDLTKEAAVKIELFKGRLDSRIVFNFNFLMLQLGSSSWRTTTRIARASWWD